MIDISSFLAKIKSKKMPSIFLYIFLLLFYNKKKRGDFMSKTVNVNFKLNEDVKKMMEQACDELGLSMSAAFTIFAKKVGREKRIPFEISVDPFYSEGNISYLEKKYSDYKSGKLNFSTHDIIQD